MGRVIFVVILLIFSVVVGHSLNESFQKAYNTQKKEISLIEKF